MANEIRRQVEHGIRDQKGRSIGAQVTIVAWTVAEIDALPTRATQTERWGCVYRDEFIAKLRANPYELTVYPTRNGKPFGGGSTHRTYHPSEAAAELAASRKLEAQAKRYAAKFTTQKAEG